MNGLYMPARLAILTMLVLSVFLAGCTRSHLPVPQKPVAYYQEKVQAAEHWRDIAVDVANRIRDALVERTDLVVKPLYVVPPNSRPFMLTFNQLLKSELVSRAVQVSERREADTIQVEYDVLTVPHDRSWHDAEKYSLVADMGLAVVSAFSGSPSASDNEIVVNVRMAYNNRYVVHLSYIRYINDADWMHYFSPESLDPSSGGTRTIRATGVR